MYDLTTMLEDNTFDLFLEYKNYIDEIEKARNIRLNAREELFLRNKETIKNVIKREYAYQGEDPENVINACLYLAINIPAASKLIYDIVNSIVKLESPHDMCYFIGALATIAATHLYEKRTNKYYHGYKDEFIFRLSVIYKSINKLITNK